MKKSRNFFCKQYLRNKPLYVYIREVWCSPRLSPGERPIARQRVHRWPRISWSVKVTTQTTKALFAGMQQDGRAVDMLPWQIHCDTTLRHQMCPYPYTCIAFLLAHCHYRVIQHQRFDARHALCSAYCLAHACTTLHDTISHPFHTARSYFVLHVDWLLLHSLKVLKDLRWWIRHHSSVEKSAGLDRFGLFACLRFDSGRNPRQLKSIWIWANRPSNKGSNLLFPVIKAYKLKWNCTIWNGTLLCLFTSSCMFLLAQFCSLFCLFVFFWLCFVLAGSLGYSGCVYFWLLFLILRISGFSPFSRISRSGWFLFCRVCRCDAALNQLVTSVVDSTLRIPPTCNQLGGTVFPSCCFPYKPASFKVGSWGPRSSHLCGGQSYTTPTCLGQVYTRALVVPPSSPHQRAFICGACTGTAWVGVLFVSLFYPLWQQCVYPCVVWLRLVLLSWRTVRNLCPPNC